MTSDPRRRDFTRRCASCDEILLVRKFAGTSPLNAVRIWRQRPPANSVTADSKTLLASRLACEGRRVRDAGSRRSDDDEEEVRR